MLQRRSLSLSLSLSPSRAACSASCQPRMAFREPRPMDRIPDDALMLIFSFIDDPKDRNSLSLVCTKWHYLDSLTRKEVTVAFCYSATPSSLTRRFTGLEAVKIKGKPRAAMFDLIPANWGAYAEPWVREIAVNCPRLKSVHFRRMVVSDKDLLTLAKERRHMLQVLKLDRCSGFSTTGLAAITQSCRLLRVLFLDESTINDDGGKWLHELALHNSLLEVLNFSATSLANFDVADLETLAANCRFLSSLKVNEQELNKLTGVLSRTTALKELGGVVTSGNDYVINGQLNEGIKLPSSITVLVGLAYMGDGYGDIYVNSLIRPLASGLRKLDLQLAALSVEGHCQLLRHCSSLEVLEVLNGIGDEGLEVVAKSCKNLQRLRVESGDDEIQQGFITQKGLISIAQGCRKLEYIALYVSDINNAALVAIGESCSKLKDFRLVLLAGGNLTSGSPLDQGVLTLLSKCADLTRFALYLRHGLLTDRGMSYIGSYGRKLRWALLGLVGETDTGLSLLADGCPKLERLEMRDCIFTEAGISKAVMKMKSMKYIWVQGYEATSHGQDLLAMRKPFWNIEFTPEQSSAGHDGNQQFEEVWEHGVDKQPAQFLAYHSLAGGRTDCSDTTVRLA